MALPNSLCNFAEDEVTLIETEFEIEHTGHTCVGPGRVFFSWLPSPSVRWSFRPNRMCLQFMTMGLVDLVVTSDRAKRFNAQVSHVSGSNDDFHAGGYLTNGSGFGQSSRLSIVKSFVPNFPRFFNVPGKTGAQLRFDNWSVTIRDLGSSSESGEKRYYKMTHSVELKKIDGTDFLGAEWEAIFEKLTLFLSFCRGKATTCMLATGYNANGDNVWAQWGSYNVDPFTQSEKNWFPRTALALESVFPEFWKRMIENPDDAATIRLAIYWYLQAASLHNDTALLVLQASHELLSWLVLVRLEQKLSGNYFKKKLGNAGRIEALVKFLNLPLDIDAKLLPELFKLANDRDEVWRTGPQAIVGIRNSLTHTGSVAEQQKIFSQLTPENLLQASLLSFQYLELALLHVFRYMGQISDRLMYQGWLGADITLVPWASNP